MFFLSFLLRPAGQHGPHRYDRCKWSYKWKYKWVTGLMTLRIWRLELHLQLMGGPPCGENLTIDEFTKNCQNSPEKWWLEDIRLSFRVLGPLDFFEMGHRSKGEIGNNPKKLHKSPQLQGGKTHGCHGHQFLIASYLPASYDALPQLPSATSALQLVGGLALKAQLMITTVSLSIWGPFMPMPRRMPHKLLSPDLWAGICVPFRFPMP